jgi:hypothetical protein
MPPSFLFSQYLKSTFVARDLSQSFGLSDSPLFGRQSSVLSTLATSTCLDKHLEEDERLVGMLTVAEDFSWACALFSDGTQRLLP